MKLKCLERRSEEEVKKMGVVEWITREDAAADDDEREERSGYQIVE